MSRSRQVCQGFALLLCLYALVLWGGMRTMSGMTIFAHDRTTEQQNILAMTRALSATLHDRCAAGEDLVLFNDGDLLTGFLVGDQGLRSCRFRRATEITPLREGQMRCSNAILVLESFSVPKFSVEEDPDRTKYAALWQRDLLWSTPDQRYEFGVFVHPEGAAPKHCAAGTEDAE